MRLMWFFWGVVAFLLVGAGCGGGSKSGSPATTTATATAVTTTGTSTTPAPTTTGTSTALAPTTTSAAPTFANTSNCARLAALGAQVAKALQPVAGNAKATVANEAKALQAMAAAAPSEIRGDFETFATAFNGYVQALVKAGFSPGKTPTAAQIAQLSAAAKTFSTAKLSAAEQHLSAWTQKNCGGAPTTTTG